MTSINTADQVYVRKVNTAILLNLLRLEAPLSRAELAKQTGLNRSTVSSIIAELLEVRLVRETELQKDKVGRPGMSLELNPAAGCVVGVEVGVRHVTVILADFVMSPVWKETTLIDSASDQEAALTQFERLIDKALLEAEKNNQRCFGIGVGLPGLVDVTKGELKFAPNLNWRDVALKAKWSEKYGLPVFVENEANAAALGEYYYGAAMGVKDFLYLSAGVGLGGGIVLDGHLFRGSGGYAGEIGHMTIDPHGKLCSCGKRGCWETFVSPRAIEQQVNELIGQGSESILREMQNVSSGALQFEQIIKAARRGDVIAKEAVNQAAWYLGIGVSNLVNVFNPQLIILGGALRSASDLLRPVVEKVVADNSLKQPLEILNIQDSVHALNAGAIGAASLVLDDMMRGPVN